MINAADGGQAKVDKGITLGIPPPLFIKGCIIISSSVGRLDVSSYNIFEINDLAYSEIITCSGKEY